MYCDQRLYGVKKWYHTAPKDAYMRIPDELRNAVCFVCVKLESGPNANQYKSVGTAFLVGVEESEYTFCYVVTARHVVDDIKKRGFTDIYLRLNTKDGKVDYLPIPLEPGHWHGWSSPVVDLVAVHFQIPTDYECQMLPMEMFVTNQALADHFIGPGDEIFITGLFRFLRGRQRNFPIIRSGIIAAMPEELITDPKTGDTFYAYLCEVRSIAGLSGSPVFVYLDETRTPKPKLKDGQTNVSLLLGIIRGHWELSPNDLSDGVAEVDLGIVDNVENDVEIGFSKGENMNVGIALVTPAHYLWDLLNHPTTEARRKRLVEHLDAQNAGKIVNDSEILEEDVFSQADFLSDLTKATRKIEAEADSD